jgi:methylmalonyl-CoA mutase N-terminal domain/subunit
VEALTNDLEREAETCIATIDRMGGMVAAIERGYPQHEIAHSAYVYQQEIERGERVVVGVNRFASSGDDRVPATLYIDDTAADAQIERVARGRERRSRETVERALDTLARAAESKDNMMPSLLDAARAEATVGEMCGALRRVWGEYVEEPSF